MSAHLCCCARDRPPVLPSVDMWSGRCTFSRMRVPTPNWVLRFTSQTSSPRVFVVNSALEAEIACRRSAGESEARRCGLTACSGWFSMRARALQSPCRPPTQVEADGCSVRMASASVGGTTNVCGPVAVTEQSGLGKMKRTIISSLPFRGRPSALCRCRIHLSPAGPALHCQPGRRRSGLAVECWARPDTG